jgi:hypothetical protein
LLALKAGFEGQRVIDPIVDSAAKCICHRARRASAAEQQHFRRMAHGLSADSMTGRCVWLAGKDDAALAMHRGARLPRDLSPEAMERFNLDPDAPWPRAKRAKTLWPHPVAAGRAAGTEEQ